MPYETKLYSNYLEEEEDEELELELLELEDDDEDEDDELKKNAIINI